MKKLDINGIRNMCSNMFRNGMTVRYKYNTTTAVKPSFAKEDDLSKREKDKVRCGKISGVYQNFFTVKIPNAANNGTIEETVSYIDVYTGAVTILDNRVSKDGAESLKEFTSETWDTDSTGSYISFD